MFQLNKEEFKNLIFQFGTSSWGGTRKMPRAFTEQGVAMLSSVLNSEMAIEVNIHPESLRTYGVQIMRTFTQLREMALTYKELNEKIEKMESKYDKQFRIVFHPVTLWMYGTWRKNELYLRVN